MAIGAEEHEPLLCGSDVQIQNGHRGNHSPDIELDGSPSGSILESISTTPIRSGYGATDTIISTRDNFVYTWNDINVFSAEPASATRRRYLNYFGRKSNDEFSGRRKQILKNVNGEACPGELLAILGSSGAGKTTLLNALTFRSARGVIVAGTRALGGYRLHASNLTSLSAYVQQDDLFIGTLTVREHLIFQSLVRMDRSISYIQRIRRVNEVIAELALKKCQNTVIGIPGRLKGISGGEMKRLSFASEILTDPPLMFCDEPTSGLDSFMAQNVIQVLKGLAEKGKTVVCTIHQPSSELFGMFDKLLLMAEGRVAFLGTPDQATDFFSNLDIVCPVNYNPADFYIQLLAIIPTQEEECKRKIESLCDAFQKSDIGVRLENQIETNQRNKKKKNFPWDMDDSWANSDRWTSPYKTSWWSQMRAVFWRSWLSVIKEPMLIKVRLIQTVMVALLIGIIYFGQVLNQDGVMNINGAIFIFLTSMTFQNVFAVISVFCSELPVFLREHRSGLYRTDVYFLCKTFAEAPIYAAIPLIFTCISYYMIRMNPEPMRFFIANVITILVANVAVSFGYLISCASRNVSMALSIGPPLVIPFMLFGGFFLNSRSVPVYFEWLSQLSWFKYGNEAMLINQWEGVANIACTRGNSSCPRTGAVVLEIMNFSPNNFGVDLLSLTGLIIGFRILSFLFLLSRTYRSE